MDKLLSCAASFEKLLGIRYRIVIGRKGRSTELHIGFSGMDFHHLMGLGKLKDLRIARKDREQVFCDILEGRISYQSIAASRYIGSIEGRFQPPSRIEELLDSNRLVFRYNKRQNAFSLIEADYLLSTPHEGTDIYIFLAENARTGLYYCRSFFPRTGRDYTAGQTAYTMLYKEKLDTATGQVCVQYDRLTPKTIT